jgi:2-succinyl-5-enolpyruvyl-6-hydroxy-3-cyclohexene-1-carboxylate synthase
VNPSTAQARVIIDELIRCGVSDIVVCPGSRSAPLAMAAAAAEAAGDVMVHVRIDERSAGYLALGLSHVTGIPTAVITTSGTAAVNLHPAITEAAHLGTPLIALTADRPAALQGVGANQTIDQEALYSQTRANLAMPLAAEVKGEVRVWRSIIARAVATTTDAFNPGPVHINVPFAEPLVPDGDDTWCESLDGRDDGRPWHADARMVGGMSTPLDDVLASVLDDPKIPARGLIVIGQHRDPDAADLADELSAALGWPIIAEPSGNAAAADNALAHGPLIAADEAFLAEHQPDVVLTVGTVGLHRGVLSVIRHAPLHIAVDSQPAFADPTRSADIVLAAVPLAPQEFNADPHWLSAWQRADVLASAAIETALSAEADVLSGIDVARIIAAGVPDGGLFFVGSSWPVRHVSAFAGATATGALVIGNRGTSGIDGCVSSAWGAAVAWQREGNAGTVALLGDLTFLYDSNGLLVPEGEPQPELVVVVMDNDGGGIFSSLEQGAPQFDDTFERVFGTPMGRDIETIAKSLGYSAHTISSTTELTEALEKAIANGGVQVIVARTCPREREAALLRDVHAAIASALDSRTS